MRKIARGLALSLLLTPGMAWSLGLGDISVDTGLNQALQAEIELLSVRPSDIQDMQVTLAGPEAFERAGIDRPVVLNKLEFEPVSLDSGRGTIRVTTTEPVREPFLNFLVEVRWPKGRLLREYTILLDPPVLMEQRPVAGLQAPVVTPEPAVSPVMTESAPALEPSPAEIVIGDSEEVTFAEPAAPTVGIDISEPVPAPPVDAPQPEAVIFSEQTEEITFAESTETIGEPSIAPADNAQEVTIVFDETAQDGQPQPVFQPLPAEESEVIVTAEEAAVTEMVPENQFGESNIGQPVNELTISEESESVVSAGDSYEVQRGDTLSGITREYGPGINIQQMMLAFLRANPDAFFDSNINNLRAGAILRIPAESEALELRRREAVAEVRRQNALWREFKGLLASEPPTSPAAAVDTTIADAQPDFSSPEPNIEELLAQPVTTTEEIDTSIEVAVPEPTTVTTVEPEPALDTTAADDGRLEIVSSEAETASPEAVAATGTTDVTALEKNLALAKELAESRLQENQELGDKIGELEEMLTKNERIIDLQNEQLAELQQQLTAAETADAEATQPEAATEETTVEATPAPTEATAAEEVTFEEEPEAPTTTPAEETVEEPAIAAATGQEEAAEEPTTTAATEQEEAVEETPAEPEQTAEATPTEEVAEGTEPTVAAVDTSEPVVEEATTPETVTAQTEEVQPEPGATEPSEQQAVVDQDTVVTQADQTNLVQDLFANPMMLLAAGGAGLLMLSLIWMLIRRSMENRAVTVDLDELKAADTASQGDAPMPEMGLPSGLHDEQSITQTEDAPTLETPAPDFTQLEPMGDTEQVMLTPEDQEALQQAASEQDDIINDDTIAEADVYIAYGLHQQAEELLTNAMGEYPERNDYRVKLLETYYGSKDKEKFDALAEELYGKLNGGTGMLWERVVAMGKEISPENSLFSGADAGGLSVEDFAPKKPESADIDLGADDLGADSEPDFDLSTEQNMDDDGFDSTQVLRTDPSTEQNMDDGFDTTQVLSTEQLEAEIDQPTAEQPAPPGTVGVGLAAAATGAAVVGGSLFGGNDDDATGEPETEATTEQVGDADDSNILEFDMQDLDLDARTIEAPDEPTYAHTQEEGLDFDMSEEETGAIEALGTTLEADAEFDIETESLDAGLGEDETTEALDFSERESETADLDFAEAKHLDIDSDTASLELETEAETEGLDIDLDTESLDAALEPADGPEPERTEILDRSEMGLGPEEDTFTGGPPSEDEDGLDISLDAAMEPADGPEPERTEILDRSEMGLGPEEDTFTSGPPTEDGLDISLDDDDLTGGVETVLREDLEEDVAALDINMDLTEEHTPFTDSGSFDVEEFSTEEIDMQQATEQLSIPDGLGLDDELPSLEDEVGTKLDLAKAYIDMGDSEGARSTLEEVIKDGNPNQRNEAQELMTQIA